jgi:hypothetical protein
VHLRYDPQVSSATSSPLERHLARIASTNALIRALEGRTDRISLLRLVSFVSACVAGYAGVFEGVGWASFAAAALALTFFVAVVVHARVLQARDAGAARRAVHERHLLRLKGELTALDDDGAAYVERDHPYARDIDLVGPGSLFQRIDVSHTHEGATRLAEALSRASDADTIRARQEAVLELAAAHELREELEVLGTLGRKQRAKLDHAPFMALVSMPKVLARRPWLRIAMWALPATTLTLFVLGELSVVPGSLYWLGLAAQGFVLWTTAEDVQRVLNVVTARLGFAEAYEGMLRLLEQHRFTSAHLSALQSQLAIEGRPPSTQMARLRRYEGFAQLRTQGPVYLVLNVLTLWDFFCLERIERWVSHVGPEVERWFSAIGELEMLCSLSTLHHGDQGTTLPEIVAASEGIHAEALSHPLLDPRTRVPNEVHIGGPGCAMLITGSNMAGKSTLLRALGLNVALGLAGGPVCARAMKLPLVRLRASMRIDDSLQRGASYFHAELTKLKSIVAELDRDPPVLFLLDELLRGTNARARQLGARAVLEHLIARNALGVVATHDVALSDLEEAHPGRVHNQHFTDVYENGEMRFDYKLREGPVRTSNALRLLAMAGIEVPDDNRVL